MNFANIFCAPKVKMFLLQIICMPCSPARDDSPGPNQDLSTDAKHPHASEPESKARPTESTHQAAASNPPNEISTITVPVVAAEREDSASHVVNNSLSSNKKLTIQTHEPYPSDTWDRFDKENGINGDGQRMSGMLNRLDHGQMTMSYDE